MIFGLQEAEQQFKKKKVREKSNFINIYLRVTNSYTQVVHHTLILK